MNLFNPMRNFLTSFILILLIATFCCCTDANKTADTKSKSYITTITSADQLNKIMVKAKDRLLMFDLYDNACMSCHLLLPQLEEIAREKKDKITIYKIDVDKNPEIAMAFGVSAKPFVVYVKNQKEVYSIAGRQEKETYVRAINLFAN